ncbi:MAG: hypothetical protein H6679_01940 [Epsilonproteobacteria bacterium]|nr:hypothetical protein [Campylobacterota bacterium]
MKKSLRLFLLFFLLTGISSVCACEQHDNDPEISLEELKQQDKKRKLPQDIGPETRLELYLTMITQIACDNGFIAKDFNEGDKYSREYIERFPESKRYLVESILLILDACDRSTSKACQGFEYSTEHVKEEQTALNGLKALICNEPKGIVTISEKCKARMKTIAEYIDEKDLLNLMRTRKGYEVADKSEACLDFLYEIAKNFNDKALLDLVVNDTVAQRKRNKKSLGFVSIDELKRRAQQARNNGNTVVAQKYEELLADRLKACSKGIAK